MFRALHLHDDRLFDCYLTARHGDAVDPLVAEHLTDCATCASRYAELGSLMDGLATEAAAESDAVFTPERLRAQQQQILRRVEHVGRPARVISFPSHLPADRSQHPAPHARSRWIAGAAAAGLFIGVGLGAAIEWQRHVRVPSSGVAVVARTTSAPANALPAASPTATEMVATPAVEVAGDDAFLSDLEVALERTQTRELRAIDALTPHVREIRDVRYVR
jgi:anti-sigma factor RsiW